METVDTEKAGKKGALENKGKKNMECLRKWGECKTELPSLVLTPTIPAAGLSSVSSFSRFENIKILNNQ